MSAIGPYLGVAAFATLAEISRQVAHKALRRALTLCKPWRGTQLEVRRVNGRVGHGGIQYEVAVVSLPADLRIKWEAANRSAEPLAPVIPRPASNADTDRANYLLALLKPIAEAYERHEPLAPVFAAVAKANDLSVSKLKGDFARWSKRGHGALFRKRRADSGQRKVIISILWDAATAGIPDELRLECCQKLERICAGLYQKGVKGRVQVAARARVELVKITRAIGVRLSEQELWHVCKVPEAFARRHRHHAAVDVKRRNAKLHYDRTTPTIGTRDRSPLKPMEFVEGDVTAVDVYCRRDDGGAAFTPRLIGWCDVATNRFFGSLYFPPAGEGVRQLQIMESFADMVAEWGLPGTLVIDNGKEFGRFDDEFVRDLIRAGRMEVRDPAAPVIRSLPYRPRGKGLIESLFKTLNRTYFNTIPGYVGSDRLLKKSANLGKAPKPFPGSTEDLARRLQAEIARYNFMEQGKRSHLAGKSPLERYQELVAAGWTRTVVGRDELVTIWGKVHRAAVSQSSVRIGRESYFAPFLARYTGETLDVKERYLDRALVAIYRENQFLGHAQRKRSFTYGELDGAQEAARLSRAANSDLRAIEAEAADVDLDANTNEILAAQPAQLVAPAGNRALIKHQLSAEAGDRQRFDGKKQLYARKKQEEEMRQMHKAWDGYLPKKGA